MTPRRGTGCRVGINGYASILRDLQLTPLTAEAVSLRHGIALGRSHAVLRILRTVRLAWIAGWVKREAPAKGYRAAYGFGAKPDVQHPSPCFKRVGAASNNLNESAILLSHVMRALVKPTSLAALDEATGADRGSLGKLLVHCRSIGLARIAAWKSTGKGGQPVPLWQLGDAPDAERPALKSRSEINRECKRRRRVRLQQLAVQQAAFNAVARKLSTPFGALQ